MKKVFLLAIIFSSLLFSSCSVFNQIQEMANLANCDYNLKNVTNVQVAGVNVQKAINGNISVSDITKLTAALLNKQIPLSMNVNVDVSNPTQQTAALSSMKWIMEIENSEFARGNNNKPYSIKAGKSTTIPLNISTDIYQMFTNKNIESLKTFIKSFSSDGTSSKISFKIKPSLNINGKERSTPSYITLKKKVGGKNTSTPKNNQPKNTNINSKNNPRNTLNH